MDIPATLQHKLDLFLEAGRVFMEKAMFLLKTAGLK